MMRKTSESRNTLDRELCEPNRKLLKLCTPNFHYSIMATRQHSVVVKPHKTGDLCLRMGICRNPEYYSDDSSNTTGREGGGRGQGAFVCNYVSGRLAIRAMRWWRDSDQLLRRCECSGVVPKLTTPSSLSMRATTVPDTTS
ncbi:hypothetical protein E2C01_014439 [Portunus trituberculatus]|uniref:Uncharacterized protein n=1 Tax=Portunus trituberculatus TaxID=210409 RepID=A0A5B7DK40_PORTR|nr:hypothetical protein [Portunus trituberculatus]